MVGKEWGWHRSKPGAGQPTIRLRFFDYKSS